VAFEPLLRNPKECLAVQVSGVVCPSFSHLLIVEVNVPKKIPGPATNSRSNSFLVCLLSLSVLKTRKPSTQKKNRLSDSPHQFQSDFLLTTTYGTKFSLSAWIRPLNKELIGPYLTKNPYKCHIHNKKPVD